MAEKITIEKKGYDTFIHGIAELEGCECTSWGENLLLVTDSQNGKHLVNKAIGKTRKIAEPGKLVGFTDEEIDFETLDKHDHTHNAHPRRIQFANINRWEDCKHGLIALSWMLYPDGRYFADEDGFGMDDNDEVTAYCVMNDSLEVVRPFTIVKDVDRLLKEVAAKTRTAHARTY